MKKLYAKSEIWFAVVWIIAYVVLASAGDNISADLGIEKIVTLPILIALSALYIFPEDILDAIRADSVAWAHFEAFSQPYKRIRVAYIDAARKRPEEFKKRLDSFLRKTREGKRIPGYGGVDKYYD